MSLHANARAPYGATTSRESGQAILELALVVPILVVLVMAIFQFAFVMETQVGMTNAVREAARRAAATTTPAPVWADLRLWVQAQLCGDATTPCSGGLLHENVQGFDPNRLVPDQPTQPTVTFCSYPAAGAQQYRIQVDVTYQHPLFFGPMAFATDAVDGNPNGSWDLSTTAQMRLENVDDSDPNFDDPPACVP